MTGVNLCRNVSYAGMLAAHECQPHLNAVHAWMLDVSGGGDPHKFDYV